MLCQSPQSGYDLRKIFETTALGNHSGSPGAIYPPLRRLEQQGFVEGEVDTTMALRPKKVFHPTKAGRETLSDWLVREIEREDVERRIDELLLRFAFHSETPLHPRLALAAGIEQYRACARWARKAMKEFREEDS